MITCPLIAARAARSLLVLLALTLIAPSALAHESTQALVYHPAELSYPDGRQSLLKRIRDLARRTCPRYGKVRELAEITRCQRVTTKQLVAQIGDPGFAAFAARANAKRAERVQLVQAR